jgi:uncharacterized protein YndB with AHSA1/START domain
MKQTPAATPSEFVGDREIVISRVFEAPRELLWNAWTDPAHIASWWGPRGFTAPPCEIDLRPGGEFLVVLDGPDGNKYPCRGVFKEIVENEKLVYEGPANEPAGCGAGIPPNALVTVTFTDRGGETELTIHTVLDSSESRKAAAAEGFVAGWNDSLDRLAENLGIDTP